MPLTLSPFRYIQIAQFMLRRLLDQAPSASAWKGKGRAAPLIKGAMAMGADAGLYRSSLEERRSWNDMVPPDNTPGPSTYRSKRDVYSPPPQQERRQPLRPDPTLPKEPTEIYRLMNDERLLHPASVKPPKDVVVLCHGLYGFSTATPIPLFPSLKLHYWASVLEILRDQMGVNVLVVGVKGTGSIKERAEQMHQFLKDKLPRGSGVNFVAHSMGGLDCRYLISTIQPTTYTPVSLTTIGTPHHGSPFMDWCAANIGVGSAAATAMAGAAALGAKALPYSLKSPILARTAGELAKKESSGISSWTAGLTSYLLNIFDSPAYSNLTTAYLRDHFNPATPDLGSVKYTSVAGRVNKLSVLHPLWFPKLVLDAAAEHGYGGEGGKGYEGNDGLVSVSSAKWGQFLGAVDETHHWDLRGEGGLFPTPSSFTDGDEKKKIEGKKPEDGSSSSIPGFWDWQGDFGNGVSEHLGLAAEAARSTASGAMDKVQSAGVKAIEAGKAGMPNMPTMPTMPTMPSMDQTKSSNPSHSSSANSWDLAQVGQVLDWVTDLIPGGDNAETKKKQMADATREKEKAEASRDASSSGKNGQEAQRKEAERKKKEKFDLARFYGGLMLKLRDDGF